LTDHLRREGRRPAVPLSSASDSTGDWQISDSARHASSIARSGERKGLEEKAIVDALREQIDRWREKGEWTKLMCAELLFVRGWANKDVAEELNITEQQVANYKFDFIARLRTLVKRQDLSAEVFPELYVTE
jgi:RNA polymerase sigma-70 factor (ECF subfamily)